MGEIEAVLAEGDFDFLLASSHMHVFVKDFERYTFNEFAAMALENAIQSAESGLFSAISHPDMYRFAFEKPGRFPLIDDGYEPSKHWNLIDQLLDTVKKQNMYMEINPHMAESKGDLFYLYPQREIMERALASGVRFSYGSDAHVSGSVGALLDELEADSMYGIALRQWEDS